MYTKHRSSKLRVGQKGEALMGRQKIVLSLTDEAVQVLSERATERKRGEYLSNLLLVGEPAKATQRVPAEPGILERIEQRLIRIEALLQATTATTKD
jgi:hypothetical protein